MKEVLDTAISRHKAGMFKDASALYSEVLATDGSNTRALHLLGLLRHQQGDHSSAIELLCKSLAIQPNMPVVHANLSDAYRGGVVSSTVPSVLAGSRFGCPRIAPRRCATWA